MFKELFALTENAPLLLLIKREGDDKLRININRKSEEDDKETPLSLSLLGTPAEFDAELPLALAEGLALHDAEKVPVSVTDQVKGQVAAAKEDEKSPAARRTPRPRKTAKARPAKPKATEKKSAAPAKPAKSTKAPRAPKASRSDAAKRSTLVPNAALAAVIGPEAVRHNEAIAKIWEYIKANSLQDPKKKRVIKPDEKLDALAPGKKFAVETLGKIVRANMVEATGATTAQIEPKITPLIKPMSEPAPTAQQVPAIKPLLPAEKLAEMSASAQPAAEAAATPVAPTPKAEAKPAPAPQTASSADDLEL